ncbi:acyltransferase family protein [Nocardioides daphniae]|uniref:Acyltransferase n=1 Tax=Nocardioides daphniae TaxID=402297 RepID=A0A4P7UBJ3_9ACTN|nr:acyltransferase [Nocardioides daphniae]QCC77480.1 acyltransferase [Nocardioides daphniae]GGD31621.1 acyltransferase [Nocardioides daphniae]
MGPAQDAAGSGRLDLLDYLRFAAAMMVVLFHYLFWGIQFDRIDVTLTPLAEVVKYGYLGVDLFFLISGFVIMNSARGKAPSRFAVSRARRLLPAFWVAMLVTAAVIALFGDRVDLSVTPRQVLVNLTMVPTLLGQPAVDGVYWTLVHELLFYAGVFVLMVLRLGPRIPTLIPLWAIGMGVVLLVAPQLQAGPFLGNFYGYFAIGAILAEVRHTGRWNALQATGFLVGLGVVLRWAVVRGRAEGELDDTTFNEAILLGVVLLWVALVASMLIPRVAALRLPKARLAGALTYPLYLVHARMGYVAMSFLITDANKWIVYPLTVAAALGLAALVHKWEELPWWRQFFERTVGRPLSVLDPPIRTRKVSVPAEAKLVPPARRAPE